MKPRLPTSVFFAYPPYFIEFLFAFFNIISYICNAVTR